MRPSHRHPQHSERLHMTDIRDTLGFLQTWSQTVNYDRGAVVVYAMMNSGEAEWESCSK